MKYIHQREHLNEDDVVVIDAQALDQDHPQVDYAAELSGGYRCTWMRW